MNKATERGELVVFDTTVRQEPDTKFLSLTDLGKATDKVKDIYGRSNRDINQILSNKVNQERIFYMLKNQGIITNWGFIDFMKKVEDDGVINVLKKLKVYKTNGKGKDRIVNCNAYIWVLVAMEMNPKLYAMVITRLGDKVLNNKIKISEIDKGLKQSMQKLHNANYAEIEKGINYIIYNKHKTGIRNNSTIEQLKELEELEKNIALSIDMGYVNSYEQLLVDLRTIYRKKYG
jgi:hypothetical protein